MFAAASLLTLLTAFIPQETTVDDVELQVLTRRLEVLETAQRYLNHKWIGSERNVLHGPDADGVHVDTPDSEHLDNGFRMDGSENTGIPYQWGGFATPESFDLDLAAGLAAGHIPSARSAARSRHATGVDCSGFVSRCWGLAQKRSTRSLPDLCLPLDDFSNLVEGDVLNRFDGHVVLFFGYTDEDRTTARIAEAAFPGVKIRSVNLEAMKKEGYHALRYLPLDLTWAQRHPEVAEEFCRRDSPPDCIETDEVDPPTWLDHDVEPWSAGVGAWVEYAIENGLDPTMGTARLRIMIADLTEDEIQLNVTLTSANGSTVLMKMFPRDKPMPALASLPFTQLGQFQPNEIDIIEADPEMEFPDDLDPFLPQRRAILAKGNLAVEGQNLPMEVHMTMMLSPAIPIFSVLDFKTDLWLGSGESAVKVPSHGKFVASSCSLEPVPVR